MRKLYQVINEDGAQSHAVESISHGEAAIAREFGISGADLAACETKRRSHRSFTAYRSAAGVFREIVSSRS
jgi:hypothetical protein